MKENGYFIWSKNWNINHILLIQIEDSPSHYKRDCNKNWKLKHIVSVFLTILIVPYNEANGEKE